MEIPTVVDGCTPLIMACTCGSLPEVVCLLEEYHADIDEVGCTSFDHELFEGVTPLWCASAAGHFDIVKILVAHGASVNNTTKFQSTPLRAACFDGHLDIVKFLIQNGADIEIPNESGHTCLMIACLKGHYNIVKCLLECGVDVNRKSDEGNTALHDCAESGNLEIFKMLLKHDAELVPDCSGKTPLLIAAANGHASIVEYIIKENSCTNVEKEKALKLLGAYMVSEKDDIPSAIDHWKRAMQLQDKNKGIPLENSATESPFESYFEEREACTLDQLEELIYEPDKVKMQALLVKNRILGSNDSESLQSIRLTGGKYADQEDYDKCLRLWIYELDVQQQLQQPLSEIFNDRVFSLYYLLSFKVSKSEADFRDNLFQYILRVFKMVVKEIERTVELNESQDLDLGHNKNFHEIVKFSLNLVNQMFKLTPPLSEPEITELKIALRRFVCLNLKAQDDWTLLHIACCEYSELSAPVARLLLEGGASPNSVDIWRNTPLHIVAMHNSCPRDVFKLLLEYGAHLDFRNSERQTALEILKDIDRSKLDVNLLDYLKLQCLCAQAIQKHKIPYKILRNRKLKEFIEAH